MTDLHQTVLARLRTSGDEGLPFWALRPLHESGGAVQEALRDLEAGLHIARDPETERYRLVEPVASDESCGKCWACLDGASVDHMVVCATCGNKRCPHANNCAYACTASNEPGQPGSAYPSPTDPLPESERWSSDDRWDRQVFEAADAILDRSTPASEPVGSLWTTPAVPGAGGLPAAKVPGLEADVRILTLDDVAEPVMPLDRIGIEVARLMTQQVGILDRLHRLEHPEPAGPVAPPLGVHVEALKERAAIVAFICKHANTNLEDREEQEAVQLAGWIERGLHLPKEGA